MEDRKQIVETKIVAKNGDVIDTKCVTSFNVKEYVGKIDTNVLNTGAS